jgi:hypothetical protein
VLKTQEGEDVGKVRGKGNRVALEGEWVAFLHDPQRRVSGEEGAYLQDGTGRSLEAIQFKGDARF